MTEVTDEEEHLHLKATETEVTLTGEQVDQPASSVAEVSSPVGTLLRPVAEDATAAVEQPRDDEAEDNLPVGTFMRPVCEDTTDVVEQVGDHPSESSVSEHPSSAVVTFAEKEIGQPEVKSEERSVQPEVKVEERPVQEKARGARKWNVDTSYINHRTADPNCLEVRRAAHTEDDAGGEVAPAGTGVGAAAASVSTRGENGRWQVDISYINHRTGEVDNLEKRRTSLAASAQGEDGKEEQIAGKPASAPPSATVQRESGGKWRVDTSYIGYRTGDPNNMRRDDNAARQDQFADPAEKKYDYDMLKSGSPRPADVDPTCKERYLLEEEFRALFGMEYKNFSKMPKWKQQNLKKAKQLF